MKNILKHSGIAALIAMAGLISCGSSKNTAGNIDPVVFRQGLDSGSWLFTVTNIIPQSGGARQPNGVYTMSYSVKELNVNLPYFGRAYSGADVFNSPDPLSFVSKEFTVDKQRMKDDKWRFVFKPSDQPQLQSITCEIYDNGSASLDVILSNRSPISYKGTVKVKK